MLTIACGGGGNSNEHGTANDTPAVGAGNAGTSGAAGTSGDAANRDANQGQARQFVEEMAMKGMAEVQLGQLASQKASSPDVKQFGQMMVKAHTQSNNELKQIASQLNVQVPAQLDDEHRELHERLSKLQGAEFDREYMNAMVEDHEEVINKLEDRANQNTRNNDSNNPNAGATGTSGNNAQGEQALSQWAQKTLPIVQKHHQRAEQINEKVGRRTTDNNRQ